MPIDLETLKSERDRLKQALREVETEARETDARLKLLRQQELKTRREIEALGTLIELQDVRSEPAPDEDKNKGAGG